MVWWLVLCASTGSLGSTPAWGSKILRSQILRCSPVPPKKCCALRICCFLQTHHRDPQRLCLDAHNSFLITYKATSLKPLHLNLNPVAKWLFKTVTLSHPLLSNSNDIASGSEKSYTNFTESPMTVQNPPSHLPTPWLSSLPAPAPSPLRHSRHSAALGPLHLVPLRPGLCPRTATDSLSSSCLHSSSIFSVRLSPPNPCIPHSPSLHYLMAFIKIWHIKYQAYFLISLSLLIDKTKWEQRVFSPIFSLLHLQGLTHHKHSIIIYWISRWQKNVLKNNWC